MDPDERAGAGIEFPQQYEWDVVLRDGSTLHLRPIRPDDRRGVADFYRELSSENLYYRFLTVPKLEGERLELMLTIGRAGQFVLVGDLRKRIVAVAGYSRIDGTPDRAEVAFAIADALQGRGVGTQLLEQGGAGPSRLDRPSHAPCAASSSANQASVSARASGTSSRIETPRAPLTMRCT